VHPRFRLCTNPKYKYPVKYFDVGVSGADVLVGSIQKERFHQHRMILVVHKFYPCVPFEWTCCRPGGCPYGFADLLQISTFEHEKKDGTIINGRRTRCYESIRHPDGILMFIGYTCPNYSLCEECYLDQWPDSRPNRWEDVHPND
jgi:hypothetical protein